MESSLANTNKRSLKKDVDHKGLLREGSGADSRDYCTNNRSDFEFLYRELFDQLYFYARRFISREDAEDVLANVFYKLWKSGFRFSGVRQAKVFLQITVKNECLNRLRHEKYKKAYRQYVSRTDNDLSQSYWAETEIKAALINKIREAIEKLPRQCKIICKLSFLEGMSNEEIANVLRLSQNTIVNQKVNGLIKLRKACQNILLIVILFILF